ncbi:hypothetical protein DL770_011012 [Monosporascus sp. CRB-9-2]|nr:hypothetical protein DL770_011012 [Monosporascus sp. CRB-9-2]
MAQLSSSQKLQISWSTFDLETQLSGEEINPFIRTYWHEAGEAMVPVASVLMLIGPQVDRAARRITVKKPKDMTQHLCTSPKGSIPQPQEMFESE